MALLFSLKQGALLPAPELTLSAKPDFDLAAASAVEFRYRKQGTPPGSVETVPLVVTNATAKIVTLAPTSGMVDTVGIHDCHIKVTIAGKDMYFPAYGFDTFRIGDVF